MSVWLNEIPMSFCIFCGMRMYVSDKICTVGILNAYVYLYQLLDLILLLRFLDAEFGHLLYFLPSIMSYIMCYRFLIKMWTTTVANSTILYMGDSSLVD